MLKSNSHNTSQSVFFMFQVSNSGSNSECGISERTRIVGGTEATPGEWPWAVIVGKPKESSFQVESKYILNLN